MAPRSKAMDRPTKAPNAFKLLAVSDSILAEIMFWLPREDLLAAMYTCRRFFTVGLPCLLRRRHYIRRLNQLAPFREYLATICPAGFSLLQDLQCDLWHPDTTFATPVIPAEDIDMLLDVLRQATNLRTLCVSAYVLRALGTKAFHVFGSMAKLRCLDLYDHHMVSVPRTVVATDLHSKFGTFTLETRSLEKPALCRVFLDIPDALEKLVLRNVSLSALDSYYPLATRLTCYACHLPSLAALVPSFPNLDVLTLGNPLLPKRSPAFQDWVLCRQANGAYQREDASPQWHPLSLVVASWTTLFALDLQCPVTSLVLDLSGWSDSLEELADVLKPLKLNHLRILEPHIRPAKLVSLLFGSGTLATLRRFDLTLSMSLFGARGDKDEEVAIPAALHNLVSRSSIQMLDCLITCRHSGRVPSPEFNLRDIGRRLAEASNSLYFVKLVLETQSPPLVQSYYGSISRNDGEQYLHEVITRDGMSYIDGMFLPSQMPTYWHRQSTQHTYI